MEGGEEILEVGEGEGFKESALLMSISFGKICILRPVVSRIPQQEEIKGVAGG